MTARYMSLWHGYEWNVGCLNLSADCSDFGNDDNPESGPWHLSPSWLTPL